MNEDFSLYFASVADALILLAVLIISGVALTTGFKVVKKNQQRRFISPDRSPAWESFSMWLIITVAVILSVHLIKIFCWPDWLTVFFAGAIAILQILLNCIVSRDLEAAYLPLKHEQF